MGSEVEPCGVISGSVEVNVGDEEGGDGFAIGVLESIAGATGCETALEEIPSEKGTSFFCNVEVSWLAESAVSMHECSWDDCAGGGTADGDFAGGLVNELTELSICTPNTDKGVSSSAEDREEFMG